MRVASAVVPAGENLTESQIKEQVFLACAPARYRGKRVLAIVPDGTRTAPVGSVWRALYDAIGETTAAVDVLIALGTHQPMSEAAICQRLEMSGAERATRYGRVRFFNHAWNDPGALRRVGVIPAADIGKLSGGLFEMDVAVDVNRRLFDYDELVIIGPVFPHEVVGFSGGNKYLFPGVAGPDILNFFHWLGAVITTPRVIGSKWTAVRRVVDRAGAMVAVPKLCFCLVVEGAGLAGLFWGTPEEAWAAASDLSRERHVITKQEAFKTILSCAPAMYDELWTGGKCMYKLEPVLADGGELIIYAPHIKEVCVTHGAVIREVGYHCRDYFLKQWDRFKGYPWGVLAHCAHVYGLGTFENGIETPRARVTLATGIPEPTCRHINLGYRDPATLRVEDYADRESEGVLLVRKAGERLYRLQHEPAWAAAPAAATAS